MDLNELRKIAEQATQGNWMWVNDRTPEHIRAGRFPYTPVAYTDDVSDGDSLFIATFDPPTVLALITRLEQAEQDRVKLRNRLDAMRRQRDGYRNQLRKTDIDRLRAQVDASILRAALVVIQGLHRPYITKAQEALCLRCGINWPCDTRKLADEALGGEERG